MTLRLRLERKLDGTWRAWVIRDTPRGPRALRLSDDAGIPYPEGGFLPQQCVIEAQHASIVDLRAAGRDVEGVLTSELMEATRELWEAGYRFSVDKDGDVQWISPDEIGWSSGSTEDALAMLRGTR